jgi:adenylate cyclase
MFRRSGIRARLFFAFFGISFFAVLTAAAALYSFLEVGRVLERIARYETPEAIDSLEISRQAERMVNAASAMLTATTMPQLEQIQASMTANSQRMDEKILGLKSSGSENRTLETMEWALGRLRTNVDDLHDLIVHRFEIRQSRQKMLNEFREANTTIVRLLSERITGVDIEIEQLRTANAAAGQTNAQDLSMVALLDSRAALKAADEAVASIYGVYLEAQMAESPDQLPPLTIRGQIALGRLDALTNGFEPALAELLQEQNKTLHETIEGPGNIFALLELEFGATVKARDILIDNSWLSGELSDAVDQLVEGAKANITDAIARVTSTQHASMLIIVIIVCLTLLSSVLIVWLYVGRNIIARLSELSESMESVAGGDLRVELPSRESDDEIGRMTKALKVFRDTAVEIEENNLREIGQARQRLLDAIESISEGFCYFDSSDKLVVANNQYRTLMYSGDENAVVEGMSFERIIRNSVEKGYIKDAEENTEQWLAERLAQHRQPGLPSLHQRGSGRWIMVSERKTGDGGTVAIYSDITELKQREAELAEKSQSMEQLSNQIAKYLSPQIYDSIFTGKREVKVASHRKKLSIFFSDIAGFTETAELLESEDLTKLLNHYLTEMSNIALQHGATIDKYVGDAIVIFFGDPETRGTQEDALACVEMAIAMRQRLKELQSTWRDSGIAKPLQIRIGINTGFCTVGNFGSEDRMDYTIIGSGVNLASRLESAASPGEVLISYETYAMVKDKILCEKIGEISLKGVSHPVEAYRVVDYHTSQQTERDMVHEDFPNFNLDINIEELSADERGRAVAALNLALDKLGDAENVAVKKVG